MQIVFEDDSIIVVYKEAGEPTQTAKGSVPDLVSKLKVHLAKSSRQKGEPYVGVVHRLDQPVAGLLVFAKDKNSAAALSKQVQTDLMNKIYTAKVQGIWKEAPEGSLVNYICKDLKESKAKIISESDAKSNNSAKRAELLYEVTKISEEDNMTELRIQLKTGRFHQIRAQLSEKGYPIVGDVKYGAEKSPQKGIGLCADELVFIHPMTHKEMAFSQK